MTMASNRNLFQMIKFALIYSLLNHVSQHNTSAFIAKPSIDKFRFSSIRPSKRSKTNLNMEASSVLIIGLNPALQKRFVLAPNTDLIPGDVHRAASIQSGVGGKGQDVFTTLSCLSDASDSKPISVSQFIGSGAEGDSVLQLMNERSFDDSFTVRTKSPIRTCTTIVATEHSTELVEPSGLVEADELSDLLSRIEDKQMNALCIMGSMPPGCPSNTYANIVKKMVQSDDDNSKPYYCLIDSVIGLDEILNELERNKTKNINAALKINISELAKLGKVDSELNSLNSDEEKVSHAVKAFKSAYSKSESVLKYIAITAGKDPAFLVKFNSENDPDIWKLSIPNLVESNPGQTLYPIGAGDSVASGTLAAWLELLVDNKSAGASASILDSSIKDSILSIQQSYGKNVDTFACAFAFGLACGSASCLQEENSVLDKSDVIKLFSEMCHPTKVVSAHLN